MRKLRIIVNIGLDDQAKYGIPNGRDGETPPQENDVIDVDDKIADILVNTMKVAEDYDGKKEAKRVADLEAADEKRLKVFEAANTPAEARAHAVKGGVRSDMLAREQANRDKQADNAARLKAEQESKK